MSSNDNFLLATAVALGFIAGVPVGDSSSYMLNRRELTTVTFTRDDHKDRMSSLVQIFAEADFQKIIAEQDPAQREAMIELLAKNPDAIKNLKLLAKHYDESLAEPARIRLLERNPELMGTSSDVPTPEAVAPNAAEITPNR